MGEDGIGDGIAAGLGALVPKGAAFLPVRQAGQTRAYAFVLVPGFTFLAFASAVEPLRIANQLSQAPLYRWRLLSETGAPVASSAGIPVGVDGPLAPQDKEVRLFVCAGNPADGGGLARRWLPWCSAITALAAWWAASAPARSRFGQGAGLLQGRRFTLHWENQPGFAETFPDLPPTASRFETDARIMTCGGGAAATDMMLSVIAEDHGPDFAAMVSDMCLRTVLPGVDADAAQLDGGADVVAQSGADRRGPR
jgi:AraC family carnitine catabolism transcriptional activator